MRAVIMSRWLAPKLQRSNISEQLMVSDAPTRELGNIRGEKRCHAKGSQRSRHRRAFHRTASRCKADKWLHNSCYQRGDTWKMLRMCFYVYLPWGMMLEDVTSKGSQKWFKIWHMTLVQIFLSWKSSLKMIWIQKYIIDSFILDVTIK
jgi:hypothetical protein